MQQQVIQFLAAMANEQSRMRFAEVVSTSGEWTSGSERAS